MPESFTEHITNLECADCARGIEASLRHLDGVLSAELNFSAGTLHVEYDPAQVSRPDIITLIERLGYGVEGQRRPQVTALRLEGLDCADCAAKLEAAIRAVPGVQAAQLNFGAGLLNVTYSGDAAVLAQVRQRVGEAGYSAHLAEPAPAQQPADAGWRRFLPRGARERSTLLSAIGLLAGVLAEAAGAPLWAYIPFFALAIVAGGWQSARAGWLTLRATHTLDMNALMTIAVIGAALIGQWAEGATVIFLFAVGNLLEARTMDRARRSIRALIDTAPATATLIHGDHQEQAPVSELHVGDRILVRPGERIPMDGKVLAGASSVNQAPITGESAPAEKGAGDAVFAGSINGEGALEIEVTRLAQDNTIARIVKMVEEAQAQRAPSQRFVDRFARVYTPAVIALSAAIAILPPLVLGAPLLSWVYRALVLLVIACPCALVISTPVTIISAISNAARQGILIKGGAYLEGAGALSAIAFDKTGTLTLGRPEVTDVIALNGHSQQELLALAAAIEANSEHALAGAIRHEARHRGAAGVRAGDFRALAGQGASARVNGDSYVIGSPRWLRQGGTLQPQAEEIIAQLESQGRSVALLARGEAGAPPEALELLGIIGLADSLRPEAPAAIGRLKAAGVRRTVMLTGDQERTARAIAAQAGIDEVRAGLLPEQKVEAVEQLLAEGGQVAMVGDGVNDAPALARASIGIAMGAAGTDVALETADIALMSDDLNKVASAICLGRQARRVVAQNIAFALGLKVLFLGLAVAGLATLWMAVFADMGASLLVTLNGMRLLSRRWCE